MSENCRMIVHHLLYRSVTLLLHLKTLAFELPQPRAGSGVNVLLKQSAVRCGCFYGMGLLRPQLLLQPFERAALLN